MSDNQSESDLSPIGSSPPVVQPLEAEIDADSLLQHSYALHASHAPGALTDASEQLFDT